LDATSNPETAAVDIPYYISDSSRVSKKFNWTPKMSPKDIVSEIADWIGKNKEQLKDIF
jgi:UDP-glucose 4-epimerase